MCTVRPMLLDLSNSAEAEGTGPDDVSVGDGSNARAFHKKSNGICRRSAQVC
jgi:hypothetical protein